MSSSRMFFDGWSSIVRVLVLGPLGYLALIVLLRSSGKRTLSKMNAFDFVVTISLGSAFATLLLDSQTPLATGVTALAVLIGLQAIVTFASARWPRFEAIVKAEPSLLYQDGRFLRRAMKKERVTEEEVVAAIRESGAASFAKVRAVVLETNSNLSVISGDGDESTVLDGVERLQPQPH